jgi:hypothetical protein
MMRTATILTAGLLMASANAQHVGDPRLDAEARAWEERIKGSPTIQKMQADIAALQGVKAAVAQPPASDFTAPTWHYPPNTVLVQDANGVLVPSQAATQISYPGGQMQAAPPPAFYAPPPMRGGPFRSFGRGVFRGANCSGGS